METTGKLRLELPVNHSSHSYCDIIIKDRIVSQIDSILEESLTPIAEHKPSSIAIITDTTVARLYGKSLQAGLARFFSTNRVPLISFRAGEKNKSLRTVSEVAKKLSDARSDRNTVLFALGGGVVGDLAGFVASIFKRGINYFQVPTTLLAQVDSSIGGKNGVDTEWGKNQIGTFYQPGAVFTDPSTLDSLPRSEIINGAAEILKSAIIASRDMFSALSASQDLLSLQELKQHILETCRIKVEVVSKDEREENLRSILNYGHTIGHAIESSAGLGLSHGKCVILGMLGEGWIAKELGIFAKDDYIKCEELLLRVLPEVVAKGPKSSEQRVRLRRALSSERKLVKFALSDKKSLTSSDTIRMSLPERIGEMSTIGDGSYKIPVPTELFLGSIEYLGSLI